MLVYFDNPFPVEPLSVASNPEASHSKGIKTSNHEEKIHWLVALILAMKIQASHLFSLFESLTVKADI